MYKFIISLLLIVALSFSAYGQVIPPKPPDPVPIPKPVPPSPKPVPIKEEVIPYVKLKESSLTVKEGDPVWVIAESNVMVKWFGPNGFDVKGLKQFKSFSCNIGDQSVFFWSKVAGSYTIRAFAGVDKEGNPVEALCVITVEAVAPPVPPQPPTPIVPTIMLSAKSILPGEGLTIEWTLPIGSSKEIALVLKKTGSEKIEDYFYTSGKNGTKFNDLAKIGAGDYTWTFINWVYNTTTLTYDTIVLPGSQPVAFTIVGDPGPRPPPIPPIPPTPPVPPPSPAPIPEVGFRVLIVYESSELGKMPSAQQSIIFSTTVRSYLNSKCAIGTDGKTKEWKFWDKDSNTVNETKLWQTAFARPRTSIPWIIISNGTSGFEGPLPANIDETMTLLKKYGG